MSGFCERCGKELGFFERTLHINNPRINIQYDCLCNDCYRTLKEGISKIENMYQRMVAHLQEQGTHQNLSSISVDHLIFLGAEALLVLEPDFYKDESSVQQTVINRSDRLVHKTDDMAYILYRLLQYGFRENLSRAGLEDSKRFIAYFSNSVVYYEQVLVNCSEKVPATYTNVFFMRSGLLIEHIENHGLIDLLFDEDQLLDFSIEDNNDFFVFNFNNLYYAKDQLKKVVCTVRSQATKVDLEKKLKTFNAEKERAIDAREADLMTIINKKVTKDLFALEPEMVPSEVDATTVLLCVVKNMALDRDGRIELKDPQKTMMLKILWQYYAENFIRDAIMTKEALKDYLFETCLWVERIKAVYETDASEWCWAFFTPKGFLMLFKKSHRVLLSVAPTFPNTLYYPNHSFMFEGRQVLRIPMGEGETAGDVLFYSKKPEVIWQLERYFKAKSAFYLVEAYQKLDTDIFKDPKKSKLLNKWAQSLFKDFRFSPFCSYNVWYTVQKQLKDSNPLLDRLIPNQTNKRKVYSDGKDLFSMRIVESFFETVSALQTDLDIEDEIIASGVLWTGFNLILPEMMAKEWCRLAEDMVTLEDTLESAVEKYTKLETIQSDNAFYIGLFIYYLMDKQLLTTQDFLANYDTVVQLYIRNCQKIGQDSTINFHWQPKEGEPVEEETDASEKSFDVEEGCDSTEALAEETADQQPEKETEEGRD